MFPMACSGAPPTIAREGKKALDPCPTITQTAIKGGLTLSQWRMSTTLATTLTSIHMVDPLADQLGCLGTHPLRIWPLMPTLLPPAATAFSKTKTHPERRAPSTLQPSSRPPPGISTLKASATNNKPPWPPSRCMPKWYSKPAKAL